jgi:hypothetical protein
VFGASLSYLYVGDTYVGMPVGGYRNHIFYGSVDWHEYVRDLARLVYSVINGYYSYREVRCSINIQLSMEPVTHADSEWIPVQNIQGPRQSAHIPPRRLDVLQPRPNR